MVYSACTDIGGRFIVLTTVEPYKDELKRPRRRSDTGDGGGAAPNAYSTSNNNNMS